MLHRIIYSCAAAGLAIGICLVEADRLPRKTEPRKNQLLRRTMPGQNRNFLARPGRRLFAPQWMANYARRSPGGADRFAAERSSLSPCAGHWSPPAATTPIN